MVRDRDFPRAVLGANLSLRKYQQENAPSKVLYETRAMCSSLNVASSALAEVITRIAMEAQLAIPW